MNANIEEKALREIYLKPFEMAIKSPNPPKCVMSAYNLVNGQHMDMNDLLQKSLRDEWGFEGLVMSDWGGTNSTVESILAGCDLEMPGPPEKRGKLLLEYLANNTNPDLLKAIDKSCLRILELLQHLNLLNLSPEEATQTRHQPELSSDTPEDRALLREVAADGIVLLKNSAGILPLLPSALEGKKIALIGPNAKFGTPGGGGSATMNPQYQTQPLEALESMLESKGINAKIIYEPGTYTHKWLPVITPDRWSSGSKTEKDPLRVEFFSTPDFSGEVIETQFRTNSYIDLFDSGPALFYNDKSPHSILITSFLTPETTGTHDFEIASVGHARLFVDEKLVIDNYDWTETGETFYAFGSIAKRATASMVAGQKYKIRLEAASKPIEKGAVTEDDPIHVFGIQPSVRLGYLEQVKSQDDLISAAVSAAKEADIVVVVLGLNAEWESEGYDRKDMDLPGSQDELVYRLLSESGGGEKDKNIIFINQSGSPVHMPWADDAHTILQAWYGGQEAGNALWDVLTGTVNPSGRLPISWPREYTDLGGLADNVFTWPGVEGQVYYEESTNVGYRWYQNHQTLATPRWHFGFGLSYTTFIPSKLLIHHLADKWEIILKIRNTGGMKGRDVVQLYSTSPSSPDIRELRGFAKTDVLQPNEVGEVRMYMSWRDLAAWSAQEGRWVTEAGMHRFFLGKHVGDLDALQSEVRVASRLVWRP